MGGEQVSKDLIERCERLKKLLDDKAETEADIKAAYDSAKSAGYNTRLIKRVMKELRMDRDKLAAQMEFEFERGTYRQNVGLPTGAAWIEARAAQEPLEHRARLEASEKAERAHDEKRLAAADKVAARETGEKRRASAIADKYVPKPSAASA